MKSKFPAPPPASPPLTSQPPGATEYYELGILRYRTKDGRIEPNPGQSISVAKPMKEDRR